MNTIFKLIVSGIFLIMMLVLAFAVIAPNKVAAVNEASITINVTYSANLTSSTPLHPANMSNNVYVGSSSTPFGMGSVTIPLTVNGTAIIDPDSTDNVAGLHVTRKNGYVKIAAYGYNDVNSREYVKANFNLSNATITSLQNDPTDTYETFSNGLCSIVEGNNTLTNDDEYTLSGNSGTICSITNIASDNIKIFYTLPTVAICSTNSQCGTSGLTGGLFCQGNNVYQNYTTYTCNNPGTPTSYCSNYPTAQLQNTCTGNQTCSNGSCSTICTQNAQQRCSGNSLYWYDSCGNQGSYMGSCGTTNGSLTVNKTVRNITNGNAFSTSTYANPSDMLMFMITLRATNGDVQNIIVRDYLPYNLIYKNQLVVACTTNNCGSNYNNYSADISSGINIGTINAGQTVTITYQTQVASAEIFPYGTTTLNNSATATGSQGGTTPMSTALVYVTKNAVLGASSVSTGLTNNFLTDSFIFPLIMLLGGILMWKSGMLLGIEIWLAKKIKKTSI